MAVTLTASRPVTENAKKAHQKVRFETVDNIDVEEVKGKETVKIRACF